MSDDGFSLPMPAFKADEALVQIKRALRDLKLAERGDGYELRGKSIAKLALDGNAIAVKLARRPMNTPEWDRLTVRSSVDQRKWIDEVMKRLARWEHED